MVTRDTSWPPGTPCWVDPAVDDVDVASAFYQTLFGWTVSASAGEAGGPDADGYRIAHQYGRVVAGLGAKAPEHPAAWITYLATDAADDTAAAIEAAGATRRTHGRAGAGPDGGRG
jgi:predicted enzyme related to lactoylglutathione lyase